MTTDLQKNSTPRVFDRKFFTLLFLVVLIEAAMVKVAPSQTLDILYYYTGAQAREVLAGFSAEDFKSYLHFELLDLMLISCYTAGLILWLRRSYPRHLWLLALPIIGALSDLIETTVIISVLKQWASADAFDWLGIFTCLKWTLVVTSLLLAIVASVKQKYFSKRVLVS